ncbi:hypothetical protein QWY84_11115 [Aquisalimonas lutea]|uniref:hypothetical protein n=1 Tax=Aquisalimonas lutea TaxID=1327750 RepID=UPI0025B45969|nr:hypothetical protein [Aquisalimonas lutea]MDN3518161.1 hypothetical protein [Aquisalimonas lutea]
MIHPPPSPAAIRLARLALVGVGPSILSQAYGVVGVAVLNIPALTFTAIFHKANLHDSGLPRHSDTLPYSINEFLRLAFLKIAEKGNRAIIVASSKIEGE